MKAASRKLGCWRGLGITGTVGDTDLDSGCGDGNLGGAEAQLQQFHRADLGMSDPGDGPRLAGEQRRRDAHWCQGRPAPSSAAGLMTVSQDERKAELRHQLLGRLKH